MSREPLLLYYHEPSDTLGIAAASWGYICAIKWVPVVARVFDGGQLVVEHSDPIAFVPHEIAEEKTADWEPIGQF